jgi:hypothetical protein
MWSPTNFSRFCTKKSWHCLGISRGNRFESEAVLAKTCIRLLQVEEIRDRRGKEQEIAGEAERHRNFLRRQGKRNGAATGARGRTTRRVRNMRVTQREAINIESRSSSSCIVAQLGSASTRPSGFMSFISYNRSCLHTSPAAPAPSCILRKTAIVFHVRCIGIGEHRLTCAEQDSGDLII